VRRIWILLCVFASVTATANSFFEKRSFPFCTVSAVQSVVGVLNANSGNGFCSSYLKVSTQTSTVTVTLSARILLVVTTSVVSVTTSTTTTTTTTITTTESTFDLEGPLPRNRGRGLRKVLKRITLPAYLKNIPTSLISETCSCVITTPTTTTTSLALPTTVPMTTSTTTVSQTTTSTPTTVVITSTATIPVIEQTFVALTSTVGVCDVQLTDSFAGGDLNTFFSAATLDVAVQDCLLICAGQSGCTVVVVEDLTPTEPADYGCLFYTDTEVDDNGPIIDCRDEEGPTNAFYVYGPP